MVSVKGVLGKASETEIAQLKCDEWNKARGFNVEKAGTVHNAVKDFSGMNRKDRRDLKNRRGRFANFGNR